jgi:hypothetical protein
MNIQERTKPTLIVTIILLVSAMASIAQEPPPPPPPPGEAGMGAGMFLARFEGGPGDKLVKGAPYSAQALTETSQTLGDGNQIHRTATATLYRDSEGRTRREETMGAMGPWSVAQTDSKPVVLVNDPVAGANYILDPVAHTAHKMPAMLGKTGNLAYQKVVTTQGAPPPPPDGGVVTMGFGPRGFEKQLAAEGGSAQSESLGTETISGVQADGTRTTFTIPAGKIGNSLPIVVVTERWYSSQLQAVVMSTRTDPRVGTTTYRLTNINQSEPAPALFQVPADYTVEEGPMRRFLFKGPKGDAKP